MTTLSENAKFSFLKGMNHFDGLELVDAQYKKQNFSKHVHEGYTIGVIEKGAQRFLRSGANHLAGESSIILVNADDVHNGCSATPDGWSYKALYPKPEHFEHICAGVFQNDSGIPYFPSAVINDQKLASQLRLFFRTVDAEQDPLLVETLLYAVLMQLIVRHSKTNKEQQRIKPHHRGLSLVRDFLEDMYDCSPPLQYLSELSGLSPYHLNREFKRTFGMPPHQYLIQVRLKKAKEMLRPGQNIAEIAAACGFHDQSHFANQFKKAMGTTPAQYQRSSNIFQ